MTVPWISVSPMWGRAPSILPVGDFKVVEPVFAGIESKYGR